MIHKNAAYCRVSTEEQKQNSNIDIQKSEIEKYTNNNGLKLDYIYLDDGVSGAVPFSERPQGSILLKDAKANKFDCVLVYRIDRIGRDAGDTLQLVKELKKSNVEIKSTTENTEDKLVLTIFAGIAEKERETIMQRTTLGINRAAALGKWTGGVTPFGYCKDDAKHLKVYDEKVILGLYSEADIIKRIFHMVADQKMTCEKVAQALNDEGIPTRSIKNDHLKRKKAKYWIGAAVRQLIKREVYKGKFEFGKNSKDKDRKIPIEVAPIVDENTWNKAQEVLSENRIFSPRNTKREYLLTGKIKCSLCERNFTGLEYIGYRYYACNNFRLKNRNNPTKCTNSIIRADAIENEIWKDIKEFIKKPELVKEFIQSKLFDANGLNVNDEVEKRLKRFEKLSIEKSNLVRSIRLADKYCEKDILDQMEEIKKEDEKLTEEIKYYKDIAANKDFEKQKICEIERHLQMFLDKVDNPPFKLKKEIIRMLLKEVIVHPRDSETKSRDVEISYCFSKNIIITKLSLIE